jgi:hypothetical protein
MLNLSLTIMFGFETFPTHEIPHGVFLSDEQTELIKVRCLDAGGTNTQVKTNGTIHWRTARGVQRDRRRPVGWPAQRVYKGRALRAWVKL